MTSVLRFVRQRRDLIAEKVGVGADVQHLSFETLCR